MDRILKRLLRLYPIARKWTVLSNYIVPLQSIAVRSVSSSTGLTDHTQFEDLTSTMKKDISKSKRTYKAIKSRKILEEVADCRDMTLNDAINTISVLFKSTDKKDIESVREHTGFIHLCEILNIHIRVMKTYEIIECLKVFKHFKVPPNSILIQSLLQMIRTTLNDISLHNIIFIVFLLKKMDSTPLRDALLIALPLVVEAQLPVKLDLNDVYMLTSSLRFITENNINNIKMQNIILKSLWKHEDNLDVKVAWSIFNSLFNMSDLSPIAFEMLCSMQKILIINAKKLRVQQIIRILGKLALAVANNKEHGDKFYNEALVDAFINSALSSNVDFASGIYLLKILNNLNYVHIPLLEYLAAKCFEQPNLLKNALYFEVVTFIQGFINADYKPVFWDTIRDAILANDIENQHSISMIKFTLHLIALDCYNQNLLDKVFSYNVNNLPMKDICVRELLLLYQSVKTLYPAYNGSLPSQDIIQYAINLPILPTFSLKAALERALGGPQYIHNDLKTKLGHHIDHVVVMRKGGYPIAINTITCSKISYVEEIQTPSMSQIILIFNLPDVAYAVNSQRLKSTWALKIKSAEALMNSNTIAINSSSWLKLPEHERIPYLMQAIKLKCEDFSVSAN